MKKTDKTLCVLPVLLSLPAWWMALTILSCRSQELVEMSAIVVVPAALLLGIPAGIMLKLAHDRLRKREDAGESEWKSFWACVLLCAAPWVPIAIGVMWEFLTYLPR